ncbi:hypothetical protein WDU94_004750 [Cyamophila willieti]
MFRYQIQYSWGASYSSFAMNPPVFNISRQGEIPPRLETFKVSFPCTGTASDDIKVILQLNISLPHRHGITGLNFQRNKICLKEELPQEEILSNEIPDGNFFPPVPPPHTTAVSHYKPGWPTVTANQDTIVRSDPPASVTFYVALGCACALILILLTTMSAVAYLRNQKPPHLESLNTSYTSAAYATNPNVFIRLDAMDTGSYDTIASFKKLPAPSSGKSVPPSPYATTCVTTYKGKTSHHVYATPIQYYASSNVSSQSHSKEVTVTRMRIGNHNFLFKKLPPPTCQCGEPLTVIHILNYDNHSAARRELPNAPFHSLVIV